ncbi:MAG: NAD(P)-dependent oxidoreductase [Rhodospirillales bacterium]
MSQKVTVIGGSGFLGSHTADALTDAGYEVTIFDQTESKWSRPTQRMMVGDVLDSEAVRGAVEGADFVYHYAGIADIGAAQVDPYRTSQINVSGTINVLEAARQAGCKRFIFASTVYVYSGHGGFYRASKQAAESFIQTYSQEFGLDYTILRYGTLYGRRADHHNRIHRMLREAARTGAIKYPGSGEAVREFIHVRDAAMLSVRILESEFANRHLVLTGQEKYSVKDLLSIIKEIMQGKIEVSWANEEPVGHYQLTPYSFMPEIGHKMVPSDFVDLGQGLLDCLTEILEEDSSAETLSIDAKLSQPDRTSG